MSNKARLEISRAPITGNPCVDVEHPFHHALSRADMKGVCTDGLKFEETAKYRITATVSGGSPNHTHYRVGIRQY